MAAFRVISAICGAAATGCRALAAAARGASGAADRRPLTVAAVSLSVSKRLDSRVLRVWARAVVAAMTVAAAAAAAAVVGVAAADGAACRDAACLERSRIVALSKPVSSLQLIADCRLPTADGQSLIASCPRDMARPAAASRRRLPAAAIVAAASTIPASVPSNA